MRTKRWWVLGLLMSVSVGASIYLGEVGRWAKMHDYYLSVQTRQCEALPPLTRTPRNCAAVALSGTAWIMPAGRQFGAFKAIAWVGTGWGLALIGIFAFRRHQVSRSKSATS
jgi:hypothetical protein